MRVYYIEKQANRVGKDGSLGVVAQTSTIKLAMAGTQEWWGRILPLSVYSKNVLGL